MNYQSINKSSIRESNLSSILYCLKFEAPISRAMLATKIGLNKASISNMVKDLIEKKLVFEVGISITGTGSPATLLEINPRAGDIIGLEIGDDFVQVIRCDFSGQIVWRLSKETQPTDGSEKTLDLALNIVRQALDIQRPQNTNVFGLGVTLPGIVDAKNGISVFSPGLQWRNVSVKSFFQKALDIPVFVDNNSNSAALGEHFFGAAQFAENFLFITLGNGVGGGLFVNGEIYRGAHGFAGEIGHINYKIQGGRICRCGNRGCWETECNNYSIIERAKARIEVDQSSLISKMSQGQDHMLDLHTILEAANQEDAAAIEVLTETGVNIGVGIASLINIFDPEMVFIGGNISIASKYLIEGIRKSLEKYTLNELKKYINVGLSELGSDASIIGSIALVVENIFSEPSKVPGDKAENLS